MIHKSIDGISQIIMSCERWAKQNVFCVQLVNKQKLKEKFPGKLTKLETAEAHTVTTHRREMQIFLNDNSNIYLFQFNK